MYAALAGTVPGGLLPSCFINKNNFLYKQSSSNNVQFQKISILPPQRGLEFPEGVVGFWKTKRCKEMYEAEPEFPEGWGGVRKNPFRGEGMEIFWNYTSP